MKIVCGACGAKYSIADEKVQGKVFKIRCKKCSNVIVVKGNEDGTGDETINETVGAAEWYVVVDGEQVGPISNVDMDSYFMSGRINAESFAWRDGLSDWVPLRMLDDFQHLTQQDAAGPEEKTQISDNFSMYQAQANAAEDADSTNIMTTSNNFGAYGEEPSEGGDFDSGYGAFGGGDLGFGHAPSSFDSASAFSSFDAPSEPDSGGGMFASFDSPKASATSSKPSANDDFLGFTASDPSPSKSSSPSLGGGGAAAVLGGDMVGKRNENSVLFSLSSLDQVQAVSAKGPSSSGPADVPVTDGSGLIDIRALASAHKTMKSSGEDNSASVDPFTTGTMAMPALMPMGSHRSNKPIIIGGAVAALVFLIMGGGLIYVLATRDNNAQPQIIKEQVIVREVIKEQGDDGKAAQEAAEAEKAALAVANKEEPSAQETVDANGKTSSTKRTTTKTATTSAPKEETKTEEVKVAAPTKKKEDNIDNLLAQLDSKEDSKPAAKTTTTKTATATKTASSGGKTELTRDDVQNVIRANSGRISTCHKSQNSGSLSGTLRMKFLIKPNGSVSNAEILTGTFAGTDVGSCVQKAVSGMKFPATSATTDFPVTYPFKLE